jgi:hypothetical protein
MRKMLLLSLTMFALLLPAGQQARADEVSIDFFYNNLNGGNWIEVEGYGFGWQPDLAVNDQNWRPYSDGYWAYTDVGWTWISYEDFGWATYHYGRWAKLADYGWVWFPGSDLDWGPAWVSWRTGGDYVGWAPLPPRGPGIVYEGRPISGYVDIDFDIGPAYYNFVDVRYIGEPVLRERIVPVSENITYVSNTVNVTNITYQNNVVYNYGPDYNTLSTRSSRPIQRLQLERQTNVNVNAAAKSGTLTKVQGDRLVVGAPMKINKSTARVAPPQVKTKVAQPKLEKGWAGVPNAAEIKQKMKTEDLKKVPPPTGAPPGGRPSPAVETGPVAKPTAPPASVAPFERGRPAQPGQPKVPPPTPRVTPAERMASPPSTPPGVPPGRANERMRPTPPVGRPTAAPRERPTPEGKRAAEQPERFRSPPPGRPVGAPPEPQREKQKVQPRETATPPLAGSRSPEAPRGALPESRREKQKAPPQETATPSIGSGRGPEAQGGRERTERTNVKPTTAPVGAAERAPGKPAPVKKKGEASPSATPR